LISVSMFDNYYQQFINFYSFIWITRIKIASPSLELRFDPNIHLFFEYYQSYCYCSTDFLSYLRLCFLSWFQVSYQTMEIQSAYYFYSNENSYFNFI